MKEWIKSFDGLRFFFILFLMFHHFDSFSDLGVNGWNEIMSWLKEGFVSVNFFFYYQVLLFSMHTKIDY